MSDTPSELAAQRRKLLIATSAAGAVAAGATAIPFVASLTPSDRARAAGAPVEADVSKLAVGDTDGRLHLLERQPDDGQPNTLTTA